jgi:cell pole-organizing protein PopZ
MNRPDPAQDQSMEDILASIRKIIADEPKREAAPPVPAAPGSAMAVGQPQQQPSSQASAQSSFGRSAQPSVSPSFSPNRSAADRAPVEMGGMIEAPGSLASRLNDVFGMDALPLPRSAVLPPVRSAPATPASMPASVTPSLSAQGAVLSAVDADFADLLDDHPVRPSLLPSSKSANQKFAPQLSMPVPPVSTRVADVPPATQHGMFDRTPFGTLPTSSLAASLPATSPLAAPLLPVSPAVASRAIRDEPFEFAPQVQAPVVPAPLRETSAAPVLPVAKAGPVVIASMPASLPRLIGSGPQVIAAMGPVVSPAPRVAAAEQVNTAAVAPSVPPSSVSSDFEHASRVYLTAPEPVVSSSVAAHPDPAPSPIFEVIASMAAPVGAKPVAPPDHVSVPILEQASGLNSPNDHAMPVTPGPTAPIPQQVAELVVPTSPVVAADVALSDPPLATEDHSHSGNSDTAVALALGALAAGLAASSQPANPEIVVQVMEVSLPPLVSNSTLGDVRPPSASAGATAGTAPNGAPSKSVSVFASVDAFAGGVELVPLKTMDDTAVELLRPMLRNWIDSNMPRIVEKALRAELAANPAGGPKPDAKE